MSSHFDRLSVIIANLNSSKILDIGSGKGKFLIDASKKGADVYGLELSKEYIQISLENAKKENTQINVVQGFSEELPFEDSIFYFLNLSEVIEHVDDPKKLYQK